MDRSIFSVSQVNRYVRQMLDADALAAGLFITGEISNLNAHGSGHLYFTLKDETAAISAAMFKSAAVNLQFKPATGMKIIAFGRLGLYEKTGQYQLYAEHLEPAGVGAAALALDELKEKLSAEGLFSQERKRAIPRFASTIALITSPTGAALQDMLRIIRERCPGMRVVLRPALVQGEGAAADLTRAVQDVNARGADVIIIGRGGGSAEDLWAFNDEKLARAIAASEIPVISAVGHETDVTLADFAADLRAPTPTAAAAIAAFDAAEVLEMVQATRLGLAEALRRRVERCISLVADRRNTLVRSGTLRLAHAHQELDRLSQLLEKVSPYAAWRRGFALVNGGMVKTAAQAKEHGELSLEFSDGRVEVSVI